MSFLDKLLGQTVPIQKDESFPVETEEYWEDNSAATIYNPPTNGADEHWQPTADQVLPGYRGTQHHGVPYDAGVNYTIPQIPNTDAVDPDATDKDVDVLTETVMEPIPVVVLDMPVPVAVEKRVATGQFSIPFVAAPGIQTATLIAQKSRRRSKLTIAVTGADVVWISSDPQDCISNGFCISAALGKVELEVTDQVWAYAPTSTSKVFVLEEYSTSNHEHSV